MTSQVIVGGSQGVRVLQRP